MTVHNFYSHRDKEGYKKIEMREKLPLHVKLKPLVPVENSRTRYLNLFARSMMRQERIFSKNF